MADSQVETELARLRAGVSPRYMTDCGIHICAHTILLVT